MRLSPRLLVERAPASVPGAAALAVVSSSSSGAPEGPSSLELEWHVRAPPFVSARELLVPVALLLRVTDNDPAALPHNRWWSQTLAPMSIATSTTAVQVQCDHI